MSLERYKELRAVLMAGGLRASGVKHPGSLPPNLRSPGASSAEPLPAKIPSLTAFHRAVSHNAACSARKAAEQAAKDDPRRYDDARALEECVWLSHLYTEAGSEEQMTEVSDNLDLQKPLLSLRVSLIPNDAHVFTTVGE